MFTADIAGDAGENFLCVAIDQSNAASEIEFDRCEHVIRVNAAVSARLLPGFSGVVGVLIFLQPDACVGEEVHAVCVVPVHMCDDHVGYVFRFEGRGDSGLSDGIRGFDEAVNFKLLEELWPIKAGVDEDIATVAANEPDGHGNGDFARGVSAGDEGVDWEIRNGSIADGKNFINRRGGRWCGRGLRGRSLRTGSNRRQINKDTGNGFCYHLGRPLKPFIPEIPSHPEPPEMCKKELDCMNNPGMSRIPKVPSLMRRVGFSFLLGFGLFVLGAILQGMLNQRGISGISAYIDDLVMGAMAGLVIFVYEQRRSKDLTQKLAVISSMNHHVRNALQTISYVPYTEQGKQILLIQQSVNRIQWALREILPGEPSEGEKFPPSVGVANEKAASSAEADYKMPVR